MADKVLPPTASMIKYLDVVHRLANQIKADKTPEEYQSFVETHNALAQAVLNDASPEDLVSIFVASLNILQG
ncbi:MAG: hypothetical protein JWO03_2870 [Bacteroidetes bacterium]|nr:hypothetical protein [Bacteroidota bacterium]